MRGPFLGSVGLHLALVAVMIIAGRQATLRQRPLPTVTTVNLVRPMAPKAAPKIDEKIEKQAPKEESKIDEEAVPEPKEPPMKIPTKEKSPKVLPKLAKPEDNIDPEPKIQPKLKHEGAAGTLTLQNPGFDSDFYLSLVQAKIEQNYRPPPGVRAQQRAVMHFVIQKDGAIDEIRLVTKSGNGLLDQAAERAIIAARKFPPLPDSYNLSSLGINFEFLVDPQHGR